MDGIGLDFMTYADGEYETRISGEFVELRRKKTGTLLLVASFGATLRHSFRSASYIYTTNDLWLSAYDGESAQRTNTRHEQQNLALYEYRKTSLVMIGEEKGTEPANDVDYTNEVGFRRLFNLGQGDRALLSCEEEQGQSQPTKNRPWAEQYGWVTGDTALTNGETMARRVPTVQLRALNSNTPRIIGKVALGGVHAVDSYYYDIARNEADVPVGTHNPDNTFTKLTSAMTAMHGGSPFGMFHTAYSVVSPARAGGSVCYGLASLDVDDGWSPPINGGSSRAPWADQSVVAGFKYTGIDGDGEFQVTVTPTYTYAACNGMLDAHLMHPIVARVGPKTLCAVVHSTPTLRPLVDQAATRARESAIWREYFEFSYTDSGRAVPLDMWKPKASAPVPENFSFVFWSADNGRNWSQLPDAMWHESIRGTDDTWNSVAAMSVAAHMTRHTVLIQDTVDSCLMVVALPHCIDEGFDYSKIPIEWVSNLYAGTPSFAHYRPRGEVASINYGAISGEHRTAHDKTGLFDPLSAAAPRMPDYRLAAADDGYFNTKLWRWDVFRVSAGGVDHLSTLPAKYPPCDFAVSRTSGVSEGFHFIQLKPVYHNADSSVLLISKDRGHTWTEQIIPASSGMPGGSGVGLVYPFGKKDLVCSFTTVAAKEVDGVPVKRCDVVIKTSRDEGKTWRALAKAYTADLPDAAFTQYPGGYPQTFPDGSGGHVILLWAPSLGDHITMTDAPLYLRDFILVSDEDGPAEINPARPWLNNDAVAQP